MFRTTPISSLLVALAISIASMPSAHADADSWVKYTREGSEAFQLANYGEAERSFRLALQEAEPFGDCDVRLAASLTNLGVLLKVHGQEAKAEPLFERAVAVQQNALGVNNFEAISSVAKLCQFYISRGEWTKADSLCARVTAYAEHSTHDRLQVANSFKTLSAYFQKNRDLEDAEILVKQAQELTQKHAADNDLDLAVLLDALARSYDNKQQAEPLFRIALEIREASLGTNHMAVASSCENLAKLYMAHGKFAEAQPLYRHAFEISVKTLGEQKPETMARADGLAECCIKLGRSREAEQIYRHALEVCQQSNGKGSGTTAKIQLALANLLARDGRNEEAIPLYSQALKTSEALQGPQNATLSPILDAYADVLDKTNHHSEASKLKNRAKSIRGWM